MSYFQAVIIAIIEGLTEFLPVSSTAHMKFANAVMGMHSNPFTDMFEVVIQLAAIFSVVVIYYKKFFDFRNIRFYIKLAVALVPSVIIAVLLKKYIDAALGNLMFISLVMIAGGLVLLFIDRLFKTNLEDDVEKISPLKALLIGWFQTLSIVFPGLSRSAATIIGGMSLGLTRRLAAEFSFFLAVPTMFAASVKSFWDVYKDHPEVLVSNNMMTLAIGATVSFIVALFAVRMFISFVQKYDFRLFGIYRIVLGVLFLIFSLYSANAVIQ